MDAAALEVARLVLRQDTGSEATPTCEVSNSYDGRMGVRISSIFVILVTSLWGKSRSVAAHNVLRYLLDMCISLRALQRHACASTPLTTPLLYTSH